VLHTHGFRPDVVDGGVARGAGLPVVSTCHGFIEGDLRGRVYQWLQRRALRRYQAVIAVSDAIAQRLRTAHVAERRIHVIPNAFESRHDTLPRDEARTRLGLPVAPTIGWVGRLSMEKGPDLALEAFAHVANRDARLAIIGDGRDRMRLRMLADTLGVSDRVSWCGSVPDAGRYYSAFDAFFLSSRTEGTPMALLEAMAANVPVVATRVGGVPQVLDDSCAHLVEGGDVPAMTHALDLTLADFQGAAARAQLARRRLDERYNVDHWLDQHEALYRALGARSAIDVSP
jgi:glycosyltransferase involved in cell wall biosynthesis